MSRRSMARDDAAHIAKVTAQQAEAARIAAAAQLAEFRHKETLAAIAAARAEMSIALGDLAGVVRVLVAQRETPDPAAALSAGSVAATAAGPVQPRPAVSPLPRLTEPGMTVAGAIRPGRRRPAKGRDDAGERKDAPEAM